MEAQRFSYRQFFAANDGGPLAVVGAGLASEEQDDEPIDDLPAPAWFRRLEARDPFPPCEALFYWPTNYPVDGDADLSEAEWDEVDPARFRYSEPELEGWRAVVDTVLLAVQEPVVAPLGSRPLLGTKKRRDEPRASEVIEMEYQNQVQVMQKQPARMSSPPMAKWSAGDLSVCAWSNSAPSGRRFTTLTVDRRYRTAQGAWRNSRGLRLTDLPIANALLQQAFNDLTLRHQVTERELPGEPGRRAGPSPRFVSDPADDADADEER